MEKKGKEPFYGRIDINHLESTGAANCSSSAPTKPFSQARLQLDEYGDHDDDDDNEIDDDDDHDHNQDHDHDIEDEDDGRWPR